MDPHFQFAHHLHPSIGPLQVVQDHDHNLNRAGEPVAVAEAALGRSHELLANDIAN